MAEETSLSYFSNASWARSRMEDMEGRWDRRSRREYGGGSPPQLPINTGAPVIYPNPTVRPGNTATCTQGVWAFVKGGTFSYQWYLNGSPVSGATSPDFLTTAAENSSDLQCAVTCTNSVGTVGPVFSNLVGITTGTAGAWDESLWDNAVWL